MSLIPILRRALFIAPLVIAPAIFAEAKSDPAQGAVLFAKHCAMCHGKEGAGDTAMGKRFNLRDLRSADVQKMTEAQLFDVIAKGKKGTNGSMPGYETNLGHDGIHNVVAYLRQLAKNK
jgi:mono/diheme cytochrome c family protein